LRHGKELEKVELDKPCSSKGLARDEVAKIALKRLDELSISEKPATSTQSNGQGYKREADASENWIGILTEYCQAKKEP